tara:strand:+ start:215 stop:481 length:267 start_codon:yes stop_codon:yes gene_type:complete
MVMVEEKISDLGQRIVVALNALREEGQSINARDLFLIVSQGLIEDIQGVEKDCLRERFALAMAANVLAGSVHAEFDGRHEVIYSAPNP